MEFDYLVLAHARTAQFFHHSQPRLRETMNSSRSIEHVPFFALAFLNRDYSCFSCHWIKTKSAWRWKKMGLPRIARNLGTERSRRHRFAPAWFRQKVRNSLPSLLTVVYRTQLAVARPTFPRGEKRPRNRKECRVPGNRPNIFVYIGTPRYKRRKSGIRVIPIFRDRCIYNRILCFLSSPLPSPLSSVYLLPFLRISLSLVVVLFSFYGTRGYPLHSTTTSLSGVVTQLFSCLYLPGSSLVERSTPGPEEHRTLGARSIGIHIRTSKWQNNIFYPRAKPLSRYSEYVSTWYVYSIYLDLLCARLIRFSPFTVGLIWNFSIDFIIFLIPKKYHAEKFINLLHYRAFEKLSKYL